MKKTILMLLAALFVTPSAFADGTYEQRRTFRENMANEARSDYAGSQQFSDERRDLLNQGWTAEQIRDKQQAEYNARRLPAQSQPPQQGSGEAVFAPPPAGTNASFSGFSTPATRKKDTSVQNTAIPAPAKKDTKGK